MTAHDKALIAIMGFTITNLVAALERIATIAHYGAVEHPEIAKLADDAIEAAKALTTAEA